MTRSCMKFFLTNPSAVTWISQTGKMFNLDKKRGPGGIRNGRILSLTFVQFYHTRTSMSFISNESVYVMFMLNLYNTWYIYVQWYIQERIQGRIRGHSSALSLFRGGPSPPWVVQGGKRNPPPWALSWTNTFLLSNHPKNTLSLA